MDIDAFILIGGRSTRFGADKAFVKLDGETIAGRALKMVEAALSPKHVTFVAASDTQFQDRIPFALDRPMIADLKPGFGAWSGLHTALAYARTEWAFVLACDMPFVSRQLLRLLVDNCDESCDAVVPLQPDERPQPLCAFYRVGPMLAAAETMLQAGGLLRPLASIFDGVRTIFVGQDKYGKFKDADRFFTNVNTPNDLRDAKNPSARVK
jgi:molybdopterin-guanine dinucleotide biosynthesis protein A